MRARVYLRKERSLELSFAALDYRGSNPSLSAIRKKDVTNAASFCFQQVTQIFSFLKSGQKTGQNRDTDVYDTLIYAVFASKKDCSEEQSNYEISNTSYSLFNLHAGSVVELAVLLNNKLTTHDALDCFFADNGVVDGC